MAPPLTSKIAMCSLACVCASSVTGCATKTVIYSRPADAHVTMDETKQLGPTPFVLKEDTWAWTHHTLTFTKEGYAPETIEVDAQADPTKIFACILGGCVTWMFWPVGFLGAYEERAIGVDLEPTRAARKDQEPRRSGAISASTLKHGEAWSFASHP